MMYRVLVVLATDDENSGEKVCTALGLSNELRASNGEISAALPTHTYFGRLEGESAEAVRDKVGSEFRKVLYGTMVFVFVGGEDSSHCAYIV